MPLKDDKSFICSIHRIKKQNPFPDIFSILQISIFMTGSKIKKVFLETLTKS